MKKGFQKILVWEIKCSDGKKFYVIDFLNGLIPQNVSENNFTCFSEFLNMSTVVRQFP